MGPRSSQHFWVISVAARPVLALDMEASMLFLSPLSAIQAARLMVLHAAWMIETVGKAEARKEISMIKFVVANVMQKVVDRAIQVHGGGGVCDDFGLAYAYAAARTLRLADGPDEVHKMVIARRELRRFA